MSLQWVPFYPGDYERDTKALNIVQDGAYFRLLRHAWSSGEPIESLASAYRIACAFEDYERDAVAFILKKFFVETPEGFINPKAVEIRQKQVEKSLKAAESANKRHHGSKEKPNQKHANAYANADANAVLPQPEPYSSFKKEETTSDDSCESHENPSTKLKKDEPEEFKALAEWMELEIKTVDPGFVRSASINTWAKDFRLMVEKEGRKPEEIKQLFRWVMTDEFWRPNVLCPAKLREKFNVLSMKMKSKSPRSIPGAGMPNRYQGTVLSKITPASERVAGVSIP